MQSLPGKRKKNCSYAPVYTGLENRAAALERLKTIAEVPSDWALAKRMQIEPSTICKIRTGRTKRITPEFMLLVHDALNLPIAVIRDIFKDVETESYDG